MLLENDCRQSHDTLVNLLGYNPDRLRPGQPGYAAGSGNPEVMFGYLKHLWSTAGSREERFDVFSR